jgi:hypothetical protein
MMVGKKTSQSITSGDSSTNIIAGGDVNVIYEGNFPTEIVDEKIQTEVERLRKLRLFPGFDAVEPSLALGEALLEGAFSHGSDGVRGLALAWCARLTARSKDIQKAKEFLERSEALCECPEATIARAFIVSQEGGKSRALKALAGMGSPASQCARLMMVANHEGAEGALTWMQESGLKGTDLDSDGKSFLLTLQLKLGSLDATEQTIRALAAEDFERTPILHRLVAMAKLSTAVPVEFRPTLLVQVPFEASSFRLASDAISMEARREAHGHFLDAVAAAKTLNCCSAARVDDEYALWLELMDPAQAAQGKRRLEAKLRAPASELGIVRLALQFGISLDLEAVEREIQKQVALNGGMTMDAAIARLALAFTQETPEESANYIARHFDELDGHIDAGAMRLLQLEMYSRAGLGDKASRCLDDLIELGISEDEEGRLRRLIEDTDGFDPVEARRDQYEKTQDLSDLFLLVDELETRQLWDDICEYGRQIFESTHSLPDAERLANALNNAQRPDELVEFLNAHEDLLSQSKILQMLFAWGLYNQGALVESRAALAQISDDMDSHNYRVLLVNLGIAMGDWISLSGYVAREYQHRDKRSAQELMGAAQLALQVGSPHAKELVFAAATKGDDDAAVLAGAYFIASSAGWENDPAVYKWLERAAELSGDDGPLQRMSLKDILERKPEWDRRESETWRLLGCGDIPIFLAAQSLNRSLIDLTVLPAIANLSQVDPRRRSAISAYSGAHLQRQFEVEGTTVAFDATALLTLSFLKILDKALDAFETVYIPHSTLGWLFEDRQKAALQQPSRVRDARNLRDLMAQELIEKFELSTVANSDLAAQVGDELAELIAEAEKVREDDDSQRIVVRSSPVHRIASLMEEEADLTAYSSALSSCLAIVNKLRQKGQITAEEQKRASSYLQFHEKAWPNQPQISDGAVLYLDDLSVTYLLHLGLLGKIKSGGLTAVVSQRAINDANDLIAYDSISNEVTTATERLRASLNSRIESGQVRVGPRRNLEDGENGSLPDHPTAGIFPLAALSDAVVVDDRFFNQHSNLDYEGTHTPVYSTLDVLDAMRPAGILPNEDFLECRTRLRRGGYFFVPVTDEEVEHHLNASVIRDGVVDETAELKAIRESILRVRMSDWLQLPKEAPWLDSALKALIRVLKGKWRDGANVDEAIAVSNWIARQVDVRGWAHRFDRERAVDLVRVGRGAHILMLLTPPSNADRPIVEAYWKWVEQTILSPIKEQFPDLYVWLVQYFQQQVAEIAEARAKGDGSS